MDERKLALKYGAGAGLLGVICCVGPLIPILIGVGGASALFGLDQFKSYFIGSGFLLMLGASWHVIRKRNRCCRTKNRMIDVQLVLLIFGLGIGSYFVLQYGVVPVLAKVASKKIAHQQPVKSTSQITNSNLELEIEGMTCAGCTVGIEQAILDVRGVIRASANWRTGHGTVVYDANLVRPEEILKAKVHSQYTLRVKSDAGIKDP